MGLSNLDNLVKTGKLKTEPFQQKEFSGLLMSGKVRLKDANNAALAPESRFDLAYNAAHSLALAALRWHGYRSVSSPDERFCSSGVFKISSFTKRVYMKKTPDETKNVSSGLLADKTYVIHPESIKQHLDTGEAYIVSKVGGFGWDKVKVMWS